MDIYLLLFHWKDYLTTEIKTKKKKKLYPRKGRFCSLVRKGHSLLNFSRERQIELFHQKHFIMSHNFNSPSIGIWKINTLTKGQKPTCKWVNKIYYYIISFLTLKWKLHYITWFLACFLGDIEIWDSFLWELGWLKPNQIYIYNIYNRLVSPHR